MHFCVSCNQLISDRAIIQGIDFHQNHRHHCAEKRCQIKSREEILRSRGISKTQFAEMCGIQKQNVNALLDTSNIKKLQEIANVLEVKLTDLIVEDTVESSPINGYIEYNGEVHSIKSIEDLNNLTNIVNSGHKE